jgi:hypothetical protein
VTIPGIDIGVSCSTNLAGVYANLISDAADALSVSSNGGKILVLPAGLIQSAAFQQGIADGETLAQVQNNANILADIGAFCIAHNVGIQVDAVLTPPAASMFYTGNSATPVNAYVHAWVTAAAVAALPIVAIEDIQEVGTELHFGHNGVTPQNLLSIATSEALAVNTLIATYKQIASDAKSGTIQQLSADAALPTGQSFVTANGQTLQAQRTAIINSYNNAVANLVVGDMEACDVTTEINATLQSTAQFWNDYDAVANSGTVSLYSGWENIGGSIIELSGGLQTQNPAATISNATTVWIGGTIVNPAAFGSIVNPGSITHTGSIYYWTPSVGSLPSNWVSLSGGSATPLYEILLNGGVYTYVYQQSSSLTLNAAQKRFSFVTSDTGTGSEWQEWLQGLGTLAAGGTIQASGTAFSIGSNPTLTLNVLGEPLEVAISDTQMAQQAEHQAFMAAGFDVSISNFAIGEWSLSPQGIGLINSPASWTNAMAEIAALDPLYISKSITAVGSTGTGVSAPGQIVLKVGDTVSIGHLSLAYNATDSATARLGVVLIDLNGHLTLNGGTLTEGSANSGTFGNSGTFSGEGSNILILSGDTADLANALGSILVSESASGPDTIDIKTFGTNGQLSDNQISIFATDNSVSGTNLSGNAPDWASSSSTINNGTIQTEVLLWNTSIGLSKPLTPAPSGALTPSFSKADQVLTTLADYDMFVSSAGAQTSGTTVIPNRYDGNNPLNLIYNGGLDLVSRMTSLFVQSTTKMFDAAGYLAQAVDILVAPENVGGSDGLTLAQWGTQITNYNVPGNANWTFGTRYASETLTLNDQGQTLQILFQGGVDGPGSALYQIFNPNKAGELWEQIQTTALNDKSQPTALDVAAMVTVFIGTNNPFWDFYDWGSAPGSVTTEIFGDGAILLLGVPPFNPQIVNVVGDHNTITGAAGCRIYANGIGNIINLQQGGSITIGGINDTLVLGSASVALNTSPVNAVFIQVSAADLVTDFSWRFGFQRVGSKESALRIQAPPSLF